MKKTHWTRLAAMSVFAALGMLATCANAEVKVTKAFTDNAVFQRDVPVCVWGSADAGEKVTVSFHGNSVSTTACAEGCWKVQLPAMAGTFDGQDLTIQGANNTITIKNVVVGEVWICSGQSNMEQPLNSWGQPRLACSDEEYTGDYSFIRFNRVAHETTATPAKDVHSAGWQLCKDNVQKNCTACGFHFANRLSKELNVPVGLIDSNWGGSNINSWIPDEGWNQIPETVEVGKQLIAKRTAEMADGKPCTYHHAGGMYYAMLAPWKNYTVKGAIWYQGCSNAGEGEFYYFKQKAMILEWRKIWGHEMPFYWVQLANFMAPSDNPNDAGWGPIRDGQTLCMEV
ncbi:MAG: sialate O-acetylesterase, partial [Planctomycetia bacterium]|nr:sialate O-acetylesterase [Planctomycetia bacterium]